MRIKRWKERGLVEHEDYTFDQIYEMYLECKTCDDCDKDLTGKDAAGRRLVFMDHCHKLESLGDLFVIDAIKIER